MTGVMQRTNPSLGLIVAGELDSLVGKKRIAGSGLTLDRRQVGDMLTDAPDGSAARSAREPPPTSHPS
ncbi:MAG: hypothetical protein LW806_12285 [Planctomycetaceae bacterium]|nr:hypothetical protein [Planctomycetaceae bacterium]